MRRSKVVLGVAVVAAGVVAAGWVWQAAQSPVGPQGPTAKAPAGSPAADGAGEPAAAPVQRTEPERRADPGTRGESRRADTSRATPARAEREPGSLVALVQPLWSELTFEQQLVLAPFAEQWNIWPQAEKRAWVKLADRVPRMSAERQAKAHERIREWAALSPEERKLARSNYRLAKKLPQDARVAQWQHYETLTDEQKDVLRSAGSTSNTAAGHAGARTALAKEAAQPILPAPVQ